MQILETYQRKLNLKVLFLYLCLFIGGMAVMRHLASEVASYNDFQIILDLRLGYSFQESRSYISGLGEYGRTLYANCFFYIDFLYMLIYNNFYFSLLLFLLNKILLEKYKFVLIFPLLSFVFDFGENLFIRQMVKSFPDVSQSLCCISSLFTILKFICTYSSVCCCCLLLIAFIKANVKL